MAIRLLIPAGSRLLELGEVREALEGFDPALLSWTWRHEDARVDALHREVLDIVQKDDEAGLSRREVFARVWRAAHRAEGVEAQEIPDLPVLPSLAAIPFLTEPWYC